LVRESKAADKKIKGKTRIYCTNTMKKHINNDLLARLQAEVAGNVSHKRASLSFIPPQLPNQTLYLWAGSSDKTRPAILRGMCYAIPFLDLNLQKCLQIARQINQSLS
jgi:hypothetical protein